METSFAALAALVYAWEGFLSAAQPCSKAASMALVRPRSSLCWSGRPTGFLISPGMEVLLCKEILLGPNCCVTPWKMLMSVVRFLRRSKPLARRGETCFGYACQLYF
jgi:hypothetical protein